MDPLDIMAMSTRQLSPTLISHEIGSDVELIIYHLIKRLQPDYEKVVVISFNDAYYSVVKYLRTVYPDAEVTLKNVALVSINPLLEESMNPDMVLSTNDPEIIGGRMRVTFSGMSNVLYVVLGLDIYGVRHTKDLPLMIPAITKTLSLGGNNGILMTFNVRLFPENIVELVNSFSLSVFRLSVKVEGESLKRVLTVVRSPFLEYNLKSWSYMVTKDGLIFMPEKELY
ncbi:hypothetical protein [Thermococcus gorgonarius]|uniref:KaiC-like domain-containing protein n=1 Tax=Thermococcus gorgonarius TaxID=71997 RepID=A0A2Z2MDS5_THEGO|nr:hypothetical protein [Thermococcus gorgonarius]ASJ00228.1 hypothetical protein A3K92_01390 [Thermococcus gorgonarius]